VIAAEWGHGRRTGWLSNLHLGARNPSTGAFVMLGKTFKGMTDDMLAWQTTELRKLAIAGNRYTVYVASNATARIRGPKTPTRSTLSAPYTSAAWVTRAEPATP